MRCGRRPGFRGDPPISGPTGAGPVSVGVHSTGAAVSPPTGCGSSTSAGMPSAASRMGVEALPGAFTGKRGDRDCRKPGEIADLTLSSGRGPGRASPQVSIASWKCAKIRLSSSANAQNQVGVDPAVAPPCAHRGRSHEARRPWPMRAGWPYTDQQPKLSKGPCSSSRLMVVVGRPLRSPPLRCLPAVLTECAWTPAD